MSSADQQTSAQDVTVGTEAAGNAEDGSRSLAYEVEKSAGVKQARAGKKPLLEDEAALQSGQSAQPSAQVANAGTKQVDAAPAAVDNQATPELPLTAMLPEQKPTGMLLSGKPAQTGARPVQVASLDPSVGLEDDRFDTAREPQRPPAAGMTGEKGPRLLDATGATAHSPPPQDRLSTSAVTARSPQLDELIASYAEYYGVPEKLVRRVIKRESTFNPRATNGRYLGLMQISLPTARGMGYRGDRSGLLDAETNLKFAVRYLRGAYLVARGNHDRADRLYQTGYYYHAKRAGLLDETGVGVDRKRRRSRL